MLICLLVAGFLVGTFAVIEGVCQEYSSQENIDYSDEGIEDGIGDPTPCGGGGSSGGGSAPGFIRSMHIRKTCNSFSTTRWSLFRTCKSS